MTEKQKPKKTPTPRHDRFSAVLRRLITVKTLDGSGAYALLALAELSNSGTK